MIRNTAVTVCGPLNVNKLGVTYVHEHLMVKPQLLDEYYIPYTLDDEAASTEETRSFSAAGGETLVEMTPINYGRNVKAYQRIAQATGVQQASTSSCLCRPGLVIKPTVSCMIF